MDSFLFELQPALYLNWVISETDSFTYIGLQTHIISKVFKYSRYPEYEILGHELLWLENPEK